MGEVESGPGREFLCKEIEQGRSAAKFGGVVNALPKRKFWEPKKVTWEGGTPFWEKRWDGRGTRKGKIGEVEKKEVK